MQDHAAQPAYNLAYVGGCGAERLHNAGQDGLRHKTENFGNNGLDVGGRECNQLPQYAHHALYDLHHAVKGGPGSLAEHPGDRAAHGGQLFRAECLGYGVAHVLDCGLGSVKNGQALFSEYIPDSRPHVVQVVAHNAYYRNDGTYHGHDGQGAAQYAAEDSGQRAEGCADKVCRCGQSAGQAGNVAAHGADQVKAAAANGAGHKVPGCPANSADALTDGTADAAGDFPGYVLRLANGSGAHLYNTADFLLQCLGRGALADCLDPGLQLSADLLRHALHKAVFVAQVSQVQPCKGFLYPGNVAGHSLDGLRVGGAAKGCAGQGSQQGQRPGAVYGGQFAGLLPGLACGRCNVGDLLHKAGLDLLGGAFPGSIVTAQAQQLLAYVDSAFRLAGSCYAAQRRTDAANRGGDLLAVAHNPAEHCFHLRLHFGQLV